jgi:hypothetical protein
MFIPERTIYAVLRSIETSTSNYNYTFFGDYVDGGTAFREWADGTDQALVADNKNQKGNQQLKDTMASMKTVRTDFHIVVLKQSATNSLLRVDETDITSLSTDIGSIAPQSFFSIGSQGDGNNGAKCYIAELLVYDRVHTIKETEVIENYLQVKYDL